MGRKKSGQRKARQGKALPFGESGLGEMAFVVQ